MTTNTSQDKYPAPVAQLRILATSDLHMHLTGFDYYADCPDPHAGLTRAASLIRSARREAQQQDALSLLFDNGDSLQGTPFGDWAAEDAADNHPLAQAFNSLDYDAMGLGNHDFSFGLDLIDRFAAQLNCPMICSNLRRKDEAQNPKQHAILQRNILWCGSIVPIRIGVLSVLPPQTELWEAHCLNGMAEFNDILVAAKKAARSLRQQGCDIVIALAHSGLSETQARAGLENAVVPLAALGTIDAVIAGHTHLTLPGSAHHGIAHVDSTNGLVHGIPTVMPGFAGSHLGVIDLTLGRDGSDRWRIVRSKTELRTSRPAEGREDIPEDLEMLGLFAAGHAATRERVAEPVGCIAKPLHSFFSVCAPDRGLALLAAAQAAAVRPFLAGTEIEDLPLVSAAAPAKSGGRAGPRFYTNIPAGEISMRHVADLHVFPNELRAIVVAGVHIRDWLEMSAGQFNQITPGHPDALINPRHAGYNFDVIHGLSYQIDLSQPARFASSGGLVEPSGSRIRDLMWNGAPVEDDQRFVVALNNYRANGGGNFPGLVQAPAIKLPALRIQDILRDYLTGELPNDPLEHEPKPFRLTPLGGALAVLETSPDAYAHLEELLDFAPRVLGQNAAGFLQIELTL